MEMLAKDFVAAQLTGYIILQLLLLDFVDISHTRLPVLKVLLLSVVALHRIHSCYAASHCRLVTVSAPSRWASGLGRYELKIDFTSNSPHRCT